MVKSMDLLDAANPPLSTITVGSVTLVPDTRLVRPTNHRP